MTILVSPYTKNWVPLYTWQAAARRQGHCSHIDLSKSPPATTMWHYACDHLKTILPVEIGSRVVTWPYARGRLRTRLLAEAGSEVVTWSCARGWLWTRLSAEASSGVVMWPYECDHLRLHLHVEGDSSAATLPYIHGHRETWLPAEVSSHAAMWLCARGDSVASPICWRQTPMLTCDSIARIRL
jgi:hypothetical protein